MAPNSATRVATIIICCLLLSTTLISDEEAAAQTSALRANSVVLNYNANSLFQTSGIGAFLTSSWGQLYFIDVGPNGSQLEAYTGSGTSYNIASLSSTPNYTLTLVGMVNGPDGAIWLAGAQETGVTNCQSAIFRFDSTGNLTTYPLSCATGPTGITVGSDGALWFTQIGTGQIGRITTAGLVTELASPCNTQTNGLLNGNMNPLIVSGSDGNLWFDCVGLNAAGAIYKMTTAGKFTAYTLPSGYALFVDSGGLAVGPDGNIWFGARTNDAAEAGVVGSVSPTGAFNFYLLPASTYQILSIVSGPDGALWAGGFGPAFGRITTSGQVSLVPVPSTPMTANFGCQPNRIGVIGLGPNGSLVFDDGFSQEYAIELNSCYIGSLTPGASSLWPATGTTASPDATSQLAKVNRKPQPATVPPPPLNVPTCGEDIGCDLTANPQAGLNTYMTVRASSVAEVMVKYTSFSNSTYTVGLGIGTDPSHQYGTCTSSGQGGGPPFGYTPVGKLVPQAANSVMAAFVITLIAAGTGSFDCQIPLHVAVSNRTNGIVTYLPDNAVTIKFHTYEE